MKRLRLLTICMFTSFAASSQHITEIREVFRQAPDSITTGCYWYWISGNISKDGVIKDLESMKRVGINRAYIGNIYLDNVAAGPVKMFSPAWWDILHAAMKRAGELNITIGMFNAPGWSQSGGPWVKPEMAMRSIASSQQMVKGPSSRSIQLEKPKADFQDVKVIAYKVPEDYDRSITLRDADFNGAKELFDQNEQTSVPIENGKELVIDINTHQAQTIRSVEVRTKQESSFFRVELSVKENGNFRVLKTFLVDRSNPEVNVGWEPYAPAFASVAAVTGQAFRVRIFDVQRRSGITEVKLSGTPKLEQYAEKTLAKMFQSPQPTAKSYIWPQEPEPTSGFIIQPDQVTDISYAMDDKGVLHWKVPQGNWMIERIGMSPTGTRNSPAPPEGQGLEVDKMNKERVDEHFDAFIGEILKRIPAEDRKTFTIVIADSYEMGGQNWTDGFAEKFRKVYGYDPLPWLPVMSGKVIGSTDRSNRFLWDMRRLIADEVAYEYVGGLTKTSHAHGLTTWLENYGHWGFPGEFLQYGGQADEIGGEYWTEGSLGDVENRAAASSAHIYGKKKVYSESFTSAGQAFARHPGMLRKRADQFFAQGINSTILHVYISQTEERKDPGVAAWFGTEFNRRNTWFNDMDLFLQYMKRTGYLLQQGNYVADVAYFVGEDAPKMIGEQNLALPKGYSFDYINAEVILNRLTVQDGKLTLPDGLQYRVLVMPDSRTIRPKLLSKIQQLVQSGAIVIGPKPLRSPSMQNYPAADKQVQEMADALWSKNAMMQETDLNAVFQRLNVPPDFIAAGTDAVHFIHRRVNGAEVYFLTNQSDAAVKTNATFRVKGRSPQTWDPVSGHSRPLPVFTANGDVTTVPIELAAGESAFIVFGDAADKVAGTSNYPQAKELLTIKTPWNVTFGDAFTLKMDTLIDWSKSSADSIKHFSGTAIYQNEFKLSRMKKNAPVWLDLGQVHVIAKVAVNGVDVGGVWIAPYRIDISKALKKGKNTVTVKVVNTWKNRLVGDSQLPEDQRSTQLIAPLDISGGLQASGLIGPVRILAE